MIHVKRGLQNSFWIVGIFISFINLLIYEIKADCLLEICTTSDGSIAVAFSEDRGPDQSFITTQCPNVTDANITKCNVDCDRPYLSGPSWKECTLYSSGTTYINYRIYYPDNPD
ncbi:4037_t:CDS:1 [Dentiscutata erythropus]|uniref:4037_t:CDS:1 n=1 Tax=Dentiscutata erythropus TaxID=1348616 RepID=A0A9N9HGU1_9GLOM|nr:4037_t:CDS:1 [Dentiscutata erythropus]